MRIPITAGRRFEPLILIVICLITNGSLIGEIRLHGSLGYSADALRRIFLISKSFLIRRVSYVVKEGVIIPGDGAPYYQATFELLVFEPENQEVLPGKIKDIADFGAFLTMGPIDGMVHISQTMNDFVSYSKDKILTGRETNRVLKVGDTTKTFKMALIK